jgi:hypothetical protein
MAVTFIRTRNGARAGNDQVAYSLIVKYLVNVTAFRVTDLLQDDRVVESETCRELVCVIFQNSQYRTVICHIEQKP